MHFLLFQSVVEAQSFQIKDIKFDNINSIEKKLSQSSIFSIEQDWNGFMWFASQTGLDRYDGHSFESFKFNEETNDYSITKGYVKTLCVSDNALWVGTEKGISKVIYDREKKDYKVEKLINDSINVQGIIKINSSNIVYHSFKRIFNQEGKLIHSFQADTTIQALVYYPPEELILIGTSKGLFSLKTSEDNNKFKSSRLPLKGNMVNISSLYFPNELQDVPYLFIGTGEKAYQCSIKNGKITTLQEIVFQKKFNDELSISSFLLDKKGILWIGTRNTGLYVQNKRNSRAQSVYRDINKQFTLSSNQILSLFESHDGVVWVGTNGGGINKWAEYKQRFYHAFKDFNLPKNIAFNNDVWSILEISNRILLGTDGQGIAVYNKNELLNQTSEEVQYWIKHQDAHSFDKNVVKVLEDFSKDAFLIGTNEGLYKIANTHRDTQYSDNNKITSLNKVSSILRTPEFVILGTTENQGLILILDKSLQEKHREQYPNTGKINALTKGKNNHEILVGTDNGLFTLNLNTYQLEKVSINKLDNNSEIKSLCSNEGNDSIWIGTFGSGLFLCDLATNEVLKHYDRKRKLNNNDIYGILKDANANVWVSTNNGISQINTTNETINNYSIDDGLQSQEFNFGASFINTDKKVLFFGGVNGLSWFKPLPPILSNNPSFPVTYKYQSSNPDYDRGIKASNMNFLLPYEGRALDIQFGILDYHDPEKNCIRYQFISENLNEDYDILPWETATTNHLVFTDNGLNNSLKLEEDKDYLLNVNYRTSYEGWLLNNETNLDIVVSPSIKAKRNNLLTWLFSIVLFGLAIVAFISDRLRKEKKKLEVANKVTSHKNEGLSIATKKLENQNQNLNELHSIINQITRQDSTFIIFETAVEHLTTASCFDFDYAIIWLIDIPNQKIKSNYLNQTNNYGIDKWRNKNEGGKDKLEQYAILLALSKDHETIIQVIGKGNEDDYQTIILEGNPNLDYSIDREVFNQEKHYQFSRLFIPIVKRAKKKEGIQEGDLAFGVLEVGNHLDSKKIIDRNKLINLKLYVENCSQTYGRVFLAESINNNSYIPLINYQEKNPQAYLEKILQNIVIAYGCDCGDLAFITADEDEASWLPSKENCISFGMSEEVLVDLRTKNMTDLNLGKQGIYRYVLKAKKYYYANDVNKDKYYIAGLVNINSQLSVPLRSLEEKYIGTLNLYSDKKDFFDEYKAKNILKIADKFSDIYLRKKVNQLLDELVLPTNILLDRKPIYEQILEIVNKYFLTKHALICEFSGVGEFSLFKSSPLHRRVQDTYFIIEKFSFQEIRLFQKDDFSKKELTLFFPENYTLASCIIAPLSIGQNRYGILLIPTKRKLLRLYPEDENFLALTTTKCRLSINSVRVFDSFNKLYDPLFENNPKAIYQKIANLARGVFEADLTALYRIISGEHNNLQDVTYAGSLINKQKENVALKDPKNLSAIAIVIEKGMVFIENEQQYQSSKFNPHMRNWKSNIWAKDFWTREEVKSFAAIRLGEKENPEGVLFLNYRNHAVKFNEENKKLLVTFAKLSSRAMVNAAILEENIAFKDKNIRLTQPFIESSIISGIAHNSSNLVMAARRRIHEFQNKLEELKRRGHDQIRLDFFESNYNRLEKIISDLTVDFIKLSDFRRSEKDIRFEKTKIGDLVKETLELIERKARKARIKVQLSINTNIRVDCDRNYLRHAILNLILNAIEEMKSGGKLVVIVEPSKERGVVEIKITDNGNGITNEHKKKIFDPYFTTKKTGTGLGLPITKYIIEEVHGGKLELESKVRKGTIFTILLYIL